MNAVIKYLNCSNKTDMCLPHFPTKQVYNQSLGFELLYNADMRDRDFYINSIKMDLFRVVTATGDLTKPVALASTKEFLDHALSDFDKFQNTDHDLEIKRKLMGLSAEMFKLQDPSHRLRWSENILTNRCRLY